jgi:hypothetical protein
MPKLCGATRRIVVTPAPLVEQDEAAGISMSHLANMLSAEIGRIVVDRIERPSPD